MTFIVVTPNLSRFQVGHKSVQGLAMQIRNSLERATFLSLSTFSGLRNILFFNKLNIKIIYKSCTFLSRAFASARLFRRSGFVWRNVVGPQFLQNFHRSFFEEFYYRVVERVLIFHQPICDVIADRSGVVVNLEMRRFDVFVFWFCFDNLKNSLYTFQKKIKKYLKLLR